MWRTSRAAANHKVFIRSNGAVSYISRNTLMKLLRRNEFTWFKVGTSYRIPKEAFNTWLNGDSGNH